MTRPPFRTNPFSTRFTRPGAIGFVDDCDLIESASRRFRLHSFFGQIVGPHGCGKTTLSLAIEKRIQPRFQSVRHVTWRRPKRWFGRLYVPHMFEPYVDSKAGESNFAADAKSRLTLFVVDGIELLSPLQRFALIAGCRKLENGLLLTTHRPLIGIPTITQLRPSLSQFFRIVTRLAPGVRFDPRDLESAFHQNGNNIREALMELYDRFESGLLQPTLSKPTPGIGVRRSVDGHATRLSESESDSACVSKISRRTMDNTSASDQ